MSEHRNYINEAENLEYLASTLEYDHQEQMRQDLLRKANILREIYKDIYTLK